MIQQKLSLFQSLNSSPSCAVGIEEMVRLIHYDNDVKQKTESYRQMESVLGKAKADEEVKRRLMPACSVGVLFDGNGRGAANVLGFTGLALVDIDHVVSEELRVKSEEFATAINAIRQKIIDDPHTLLCYVTIGGNGFRILYRYQRAACNTIEDNAAANSSLFILHFHGLQPSSKATDTMLNWWGMSTTRSVLTIRDCADWPTILMCM